MKKNLLKISLIALLVFVFNSVFAQSFTTSWTFATDSLSSHTGNVTAPGAYIDPTLFTKPRIYNGVTGLTGTGTNGKASTPSCSSLYNSAGSGTPINPYMEMSMSPNSGYSASIDTFSFKITIGAISTNMVFAAGYSTDGGASFTGFNISLNGGAASQPGVVGTSTGPISAGGNIFKLSAPALNIAGGNSLKIRIIYWKNASGSTGNNPITISPINLIGTTSSAASTITSPKPANLSGLNYTIGAGPSTYKSFVIGGVALTSNMVVTAPTHYEVSLDSIGTYSNTVLLSQTNGLVDSTPVYVRLKAGLATGVYNESIDISSNGAISKVVTIKGFVTYVVSPTFTSPTPSNLSGFTYGVGNGPSREQSFTFGGNDLIDTVKISITTSNFEISLNPTSGFVSNTTGPLTIVPVNGLVPTTMIYARLKVGLTANATGYQFKKVTISSTAATSVVDTLYGTVFTPSITTSTATLSGFTYNQGSSTSASQSFDVNASASVPVGIKAPANYEISLTNGSGYSDSITLSTINDSTVALNTIYVRLKLGLSAGNYIDSAIVSSNGAVNKSVRLSGNVILLLPIITSPNPTSLSGFNYAVNAGPTAAQSFTVGGSNLDTGIIVTAPTGYGLSLISGGTYNSSITLDRTADSVASTTVLVKLISGLSENTYTGNISITSTGATAQSVALSGSVTAAPVPSITSPNPTTLSGFTYVSGAGPSGTQSFTVGGSNLTVDIVATAPTGYGLSLTLGGTYNSSITLTQTNGSVASTPVFVKLLSGNPVNTYVGNISITSTGATAQSVSVSGSVTAAPVPSITSPNPTSLSGFNYAVNAGPTAAQSFIVGGSNLTADIVLTAPTGYGLSLTSGGTYNTTITLTQTAGSVTSTPVFVKLLSGLSVNTYAGNITITSTGATAQSVAVSGSVSSNGGGNSFTATWPFLTDTLPVLSASSNMTASGAKINSTLFTKPRIYGATGLTGTGTNGKTNTPNCNSLYDSAGATNPITPFIELNLAPNFGYSANVDSFSFTITIGVITSNMVFAAGYSTDGGTTFTGFNISLNGGAASQQGVIGTSTGTNPSAGGNIFRLSAPALNIAAGNSLKIRIIYWKNGSGATGNNPITISSINLVGITSAAGPTIISPKPASLSGLTYIVGAGPSTYKSFVIGGISLTANLVVNAPTNYEVSLDSIGTYSNTVSLSQTNGLVDSTPVYVRLKAGLATGVYNESINISSIGAISKVLTIKGYVTYVVSPTFTSPTPSHLSGFTYGVGNGPSRVQSFTFSGNDLIDTVNISITTSNFEISLNPSTGFVSNTTGPLTIVPVNGSVPTTMIYSRLKAGLSASAIAYQSKKVTVSSTGATSVIDTLNGTVFTPAITANPSTLSGFNYLLAAIGPSASQSFDVNASASVPVGIKAPANYEISLTNGSGYTDTVTLSTVNDSTVALTTIFVRLKAGLPPGNYNDSVIVSSNGAISKSVLLNGSVTTTTPTPNITMPMPTSLTRFNYFEGFGPSAAQSFTVGGSYLTAGIDLTAPTGYGISLTSGGTYVSSITLSQTSGNVASTTIYVTLLSGFSAGTFTGNISITSTGATAQSVAVSGSVSAVGGGNSFTATWPFVTDTLPTLSSNSNMSASGAVIDPTLFTRLRAYGATGLRGQGTNGKAASPTCSILYDSVGATNSITPFMDMTLRPDAGYAALLNAFNFTITGDSISSANMVVCAGYSVDGGLTFTGFALSKNGTAITPNPDTLGTSVVTGDILTFSAPSLNITDGNSLKIRIIYWKNASGTTSSNRIILSAINITGNASLSGQPVPIITLPNPIALSGFTYALGSGPSAAQSFTVRGSNLTGDIVVTAPTSYGLSLTPGGNATSNITLPQTGGTVASTSVYVTLLSGLSVNTYAGNISITSSGASSKSVALSGFVTEDPCSVSITDKSSIYNSINNSYDVSFTISGSNGAVVTYQINGGAPQQVTLDGSALISIVGVTNSQTITLLQVTNVTCNNGALNISSTVDINMPNVFNDGVTVFPNPYHQSSGPLNIHFENMNQGIYTLRITNSLSQKQYSGQILVLQRNFVYRLTVLPKTLSSGIYHLEVISTFDKQKIIKSIFIN